VPPKPGDAHDFMGHWFTLRERMLSSDMPAIAKAAALSSSFVYIHPFGRQWAVKSLYHAGLRIMPLMPNSALAA